MSLPAGVENETEVLFHFLRGRAPELDGVDVELPSPKPFNGADGFLLASTLQKAIRRGDMEIARRAGHQLHSLDPRRCWRRLMVVALEDVGLGDLTVAAELVAISTSKDCRKFLGGERRSLDIAIARASRAVKDRIGDHLISILGREPVLSAESRTLAQASRSQLLDIIQSHSLPLVHRIRAAVMIAGRYGASGSVHIEGGLGPLLPCFRDLSVPEVIIASCQVYASRSDDALPIIIPLAWCAQNETAQEVSVNSRAIPETDLVGELPAYAFDPLHTRDGRMALSLWLKSYPAKLHWSGRMVALSLWNQEAALCAQTAQWPVGEEMCARASRADLLSCGLAEAEHAGLHAWIAHEMPALNRARRQVWNHPKPFPVAATDPQQGTLPLDGLGGNHPRNQRS